MFACPECGKAYTTQNSLKRHLNNHSVHTSGHRCPTCDQAFSRRDLMVRHKAIHEDTSRAIRRRCHTACEHCRTSHDKCNGENPCNICHDRKQHCTYRLRSRRISKPIRCVSTSAESASHSLKMNNELPQGENNEAHEGVPQHTASQDFARPGADNALSHTTAPAHEMGTRPATSTAIQFEHHPVERNSTTSSDCLDTVLPGFPGIPMEDETTPRECDEVQGRELERSTSVTSLWSRIDSTQYQPSEDDLFTEVTNQQVNYTIDMLACENHLGGIKGAESPNYLDMILPDLPENSIENDALVQDDHRVQILSAGYSTGDTTVWPGADNMLYQLMRPDFFPFSFHASDSASDATHVKANVMRNERAPTLQEARQPINTPETDAMQPIPALTASPSWRAQTGGSSRHSSGESRNQQFSKQKTLVQELIDYAIVASDVLPNERRRHWESISTEVCMVFELSQPSNSDDCILVHMVHLYKQNLLPLWPMICEKGLEDPTSLHPVLFLVAVSIGAMYLDHNASAFGTMMHKSLRIALITSFTEKEITESDTIWLAQARNTIQVVSLYFGQGLGLTYAQHIGAVLVSQSRRMKLFTQAGTDEFATGSTPEEEVEAWICAETRRRVAFGIFRADVFLSLLLNCPPIISAEELQIPLPYPDYLWLSIGKLSTQDLLAALECERMRRNQTLFCDLIRIVLDRDEVLLNMETRDYELLLFGLQEQVWKFSHDPDMFQRLNGRPWQDEGYAESLDNDINLAFNSPALHSRDHLQVNHREMKDLVSDRRRLSKALEKWSQSFNASRFRPGFNKDRGSILSSLLLFHIYHLRLNAHLDALHHIADRLCDQRTIDYKKLQTAIRWAHNAQSRNATYHASKIWSLLDNEARMNPLKKARYTVLSFMGLYHASVVLWTCFGARRAGEHLSFEGSSDDSDGCHSNKSYDVLISIVFLYQRLKCMSWDAFAESVRKLSYYEFPRA